MTNEFARRIYAKLVWPHFRVFVMCSKYLSADTPSDFEVYRT